MNTDNGISIFRPLFLMLILALLAQLAGAAAPMSDIERDCLRQLLTVRRGFVDRLNGGGAAGAAGLCGPPEWRRDRRSDARHDHQQPAEVAPVRGHRESGTRRRYSARIGGGPGLYRTAQLIG